MVTAITMYVPYIWMVDTAFVLMQHRHDGMYVPYIWMVDTAIMFRGLVVP